MTGGYFTQNVTESDDFPDFDGWVQDVYLGMLEAEFRLEARDIGLGVLGGAGIAYSDYTKYLIRDDDVREVLDTGRETGLIYSAGAEAAIQIFFLRVVGQIRYIHIPGIEQDIVFPAVGVQTKGLFLSLLPWIFFLG